MKEGLHTNVLRSKLTFCIDPATETQIRQSFYFQPISRERQETGDPVIRVVCVCLVGLVLFLTSHLRVPHFGAYKPPTPGVSCPLVSKVFYLFPLPVNSSTNISGL